MGVIIGIASKLIMHVGRGVALRNVLSISYHVEHPQADTWVIKISGAAIFSNFIALKSELASIAEGNTVIFDLSDARLIDHTVMEFIDRYQADYIEDGGHCEIHGLSEHEANSKHKLSSRRRK